MLHRHGSSRSGRTTGREVRLFEYALANPGPACSGAAAIAASDGSTPTNSVNPAARGARAERPVRTDLQRGSRAAAARVNMHVGLRVRRSGRIVRLFGAVVVGNVVRVGKIVAGRRIVDVHEVALWHRTSSRFMNSGILREAKLNWSIRDTIHVGPQERPRVVRSGAADGAVAHRIHRSFYFAVGFMALPSGSNSVRRRRGSTPDGSAGAGASPR